MDPEVPLVVPEVNADALKHIPKGIVANPNCSTIQMVVALKPLHDLAKIKRVVVATYQASSGKGAKGLFELDAAAGRPSAGAKRCRRRRPTPPSWPATSCRTTGRLGEEGYSEEEWKMVHETKKIMGDDIDPGIADHGAGAGADRPFRGDQPRVPPAHHRRASPRGVSQGPRRGPGGRLRQGRGAAGRCTPKAGMKSSSAESAGSDGAATG